MTQIFNGTKGRAGTADRPSQVTSILPVDLSETGTEQLIPSQSKCLVYTEKSEGLTTLKSIATAGMSLLPDLLRPIVRPLIKCLRASSQ